MDDHNRVDRRDFLKIIGITGAAAALPGCSREKAGLIVPYLVPPENIIPGVASWYATVCRECPAGCGLLVRTREGRAVKAEGNPSHPVNAGRLCVRGQASLQGLYNPDRIRQPLQRTEGGLQPVSWDEGEKLLVDQLNRLRRAGKTDRVAVITPHLTGSLRLLLQEWADVLGIRRPLSYEPFAHEALRTANRLVFGREAIPQYRIEAADVLLSFGTDFLETWVSNVEYTRAFGSMHAVRNGRMGRFVHVESRRSLTAANADEWISIKPGTDIVLVLGMIHVILRDGLAAASVPADARQALKEQVRAFDLPTVSARTGVEVERIVDLARAFAQADPGLALGGGVASSGPNATLTLAAINLLNYVTGNLGRTLVFGPDSTLAQTNSYKDLLNLIADMRRDEIEALLFFDVNPLFTLPAAAGFAAALDKVPFVVSLSSFFDETTARADLVLPNHTPLESWGDCEPRRGVHGLQQPVMQPVFATRAVGDVLLSVAGKLDEEITTRLDADDFHGYLQKNWHDVQREVKDEREFPQFWAAALRQGGVWKESGPQPVQLPDSVRSLEFDPQRLVGLPGEGLALIVYPSPHFYDGRGANRPWLQEIPDPLHKLVWDGWVEVHPQTAARLGIAHGEVVALRSPQGTIELPAFLYDGVHPEAVAVPLGQGHTEFGRYAQGRGANPVQLLPAEPEAASGGLAWLSARVQVNGTGRLHPLVTTAGSDQQIEDEVARVVPLGAAVGHEMEERREREEPPPELYPAHTHPDHRWGMVIDTHACIGCNACVAACYAENNLAIVGKKEVARRREMAWLRIERYYDEIGGQQRSLFVPMLCQQCDNAPCEPVCPVYATYHNPEGLNVQVYNRCVGTRYCANNCPYKVRRFNWFDHQWPEPLHLQLNPDVTARSKGVMEKCTFCVQRIQEAKDRAKDEGRKVADGEVTPACMQTCPTGAIVFGDLNDPTAPVTRLAGSARRYQVLEELNTKPAITYLKRVVQEPLGS